MKFTLPQANQTLQTASILNLCEYLTVKAVEPFLKSVGVRWDCRFHDFFSYDKNSDPMEPTGILEFHPPVLFLGYLDRLEQAIQEQLDLLGIVTGAFVREEFPNSYAIRAVRIPILENPTAASEPPAVTMSPAQSCRVLRDLLGFEPKEGVFEFAAAEALKRLSTITRERIEACCASPIREGKGTPVRRVASPITIKSTERCLKELESFVRWAKDHQFETVKAS